MRAAALVAADGVHSVVRAQLFGDESPRYTGRIAYRSTYPASRLGGLDILGHLETWKETPGVHDLGLRGHGLALIGREGELDILLEGFRLSRGGRTVASLLHGESGTGKSYLARGFVVEGRIRSHYRRRSGQLWDAIIMGLLLDPDASGRGSGLPDAPSLADAPGFPVPRRDP